MKKIFFLAIFIFFFTSTYSIFAAELTADSRITQVTVYQDRALITRETTVKLEKGDNAVLFEKLPGALIEESLRATGLGEKTVMIHGVELKRTFGAEDTNPQALKLIQELEALQDQLRELHNRSKALADQRTFIDSIKNFSSAQISKDIATKLPAPADWSNISQYILNEYAQNDAKSLETEKLIRAKNKEVEAKQREFNELGSDQTKKIAVVNLSSDSASTFQLSLSYLVPQASWELSYDAKIYTDKKACTLISYGNIRQWTGENWVDAQITLSSAKPAIGGKMPELTPWFVNFYEPPMVMQASGGMYAERSMMKAAKLSRSDMAEPQAVDSLNVAAATPEAIISQDLGSVTYEIEKPMTVLSDNRLYKSVVQTETIPVTLDFETTPKLSPYVFTHSKIANNNDHSLAAGDLNIFVNDNYISRSSLPNVGPGETFDTYLGVDEEIKVKRTEITDKKKKTLLGLRARKDFAYKIEIESYKNEKIEIAVLDELPVSKNADIKVELGNASLKPTETKDLGVLRWEFELEPKQKKDFRFEFSVEYPSDKNITGI